MTSGEFERLAALAAQEFETVRLEFLIGRICVKGLADGNHAEIIRWLQECMRPCAELWLYSGVGIGVCEGRALPDAVLAPRGTFVGKENWADTADVVMTVEVTSYDADTHRRDREEKPLGYADAGIPYYLLIDRDDCSVTLYGDPVQGIGYRSAEKKPFGAKFSLPEPLGIEIDTEDLKQYVG
ncbi:Uma2 family endonuclease [Streptomyces murinus]|uniref:Uma2 family endonuclease n=1 Tax=Streptomyces murinus TaxID=33900 RepID=UPI0021153C3A|nr:Uma2 family endonuclease [Streptomyces murinus]